MTKISMLFGLGLIGLLGQPDSLARAAGKQPAPASATVVTKGGNLAPDLSGFSPWGLAVWNGFGVGARYLVSLPFGGLLPGRRFQDRFAVEFGGDVIHRSFNYYAYRGYYGYRGYADRYGYDYSWTEVQPVVGVAWNVWFNDRFVLYPKTDIGYGIGVHSGWDDRWSGRPVHGGIDINVSAGLMWKLPTVTLRSEIGFDGVKFGVGWL
jgi:hypothetical protein